MASTVSDLARQRRRRRAVELDEVARVLAAGTWRDGGHRSPSHWLAVETGESVGHCRVTVHLAERLTRMPVACAAFAAGDLPETALRLLADTWAASLADVFARDEPMLVRWATTLPFHEARAVIERWRAYADPDGPPRTAKERYDSRRLHVSELLDGMHAIDGLLDSEGATYVREALKLYARRSDHDDRTPAQRRADALVMIAKFAVEHHHRPTGVRRRRPKVVAVIDYDDLTAGTGVGTLNAAQVPAETIRRLCCDAGIQALVMGGGHTPLHFGRTTRAIGDGLFDYLSIRDCGCRFPGCTAHVDLCEAHHARHWSDHGDTEPDNLVLLCWYHHRFVHDQRWRTEPLGAGQFELITATGDHVPLRAPWAFTRRHPPVAA